MKNNDSCNNCPVRNKDIMSIIQDKIREYPHEYRNSFEFKGLAPCGKIFNIPKDPKANNSNMQKGIDFSISSNNTKNTYDSHNEFRNNKPSKFHSNVELFNEQLFEDDMNRVTDEYKKVLKTQEGDMTYDEFVTKINLPLMYSLIGVINTANESTRNIIDEFLDDSTLDNFTYDQLENIGSKIFTAIIDSLLDTLTDNENFSEDIVKSLIKTHGEYDYNETY